MSLHRDAGEGGPRESSTADRDPANVTDVEKGHEVGDLRLSQTSCESGYDTAGMIGKASPRPSRPAIAARRALGYTPGMIAPLAHVRTWIFDLDNTLYPPASDLFGLIDAKMGAYIGDLLTLDAAAARVVQKEYFRRHGTTLAGLMADHGVDPHQFLDFVHDIPLDRLTPDPETIDRIARLPGRRIVFTNGDAAYAARVLTALGLGGLFEAVYDIHLLEYRPKPMEAGYARMCAVLDIDPHAALFVEDMARNLVPAKKLGMTTVWINNGSELGTEGVQPGMIDYETPDLGAWLRMIQQEEDA